jgi:hypothetical protein
LSPSSTHLSTPFWVGINLHDRPIQYWTLHALFSVLKLNDEGVLLYYASDCLHALYKVCPNSFETFIVECVFHVESNYTYHPQSNPPTTTNFHSSP